MNTNTTIHSPTPTPTVTPETESTPNAADVIDPYAHLAQEALDQAFLSNLIINSVLAFVILIIFIICQRVKPKLYGRHPRSLPTQSTLFGFLPALWSYSEDQMLKSHGLDVVTYLRFVKLGIQISIVLLLYGLFIVLPINFSGAKKDDVNTTITGLAIFSLSNIDIEKDTDRNKQWAHTIGIFVNAVTIYILLYRFFTQHTISRINWKKNPKKIENYTVRVTGFHPGRVLEKDLREYFDRLFPNMVLEVRIVPYIPKLVFLRRQRLALVKAKEMSIIKAANAGRVSESSKLADKRIARIDEKRTALINNPTEWSYRTDEIIKGALPPSLLGTRLNVQYDKSVKDTKFGKLGTSIYDNMSKVVKSFTSKIDDAVDTTVYSVQGRNDITRNYTNTAYITFRSPVEARICARAILGSRWVLEPAVDPHGIYWGNHYPLIGSVTRSFYYLLGYSALFSLVLFWIVPVAVASGLANLQSLVQIPLLHYFVLWTEVNPSIKGVVEGLLPQIVVATFFAILLPILYLVAEYLFLPRSRFERMVIIMISFFSFKIINIYFAGMLANTALLILKDVSSYISQPELLFRGLGEIIPRQATFFVNFVITSGLRESVLRLWNPFRLLGEFFTVACCTVTPRDYRKIYKAERFNWAEGYADKSFILIIVLCYSSLTPIILPFGVIYFVGMFFTEKYKLLNVCQQKSDTGGRYWNSVFGIIVNGLFVYYATMLGVFFVNSWQPGIVLCLAMAIVNILYYIYAKKKFFNTCEFGTLDSLLLNDNLFTNIKPKKISKKNTTTADDKDTKDKKGKDINGNDDDNEETINFRTQTYKWKKKYIHPCLLPIPEKEKEFLPPEFMRQLLEKLAQKTQIDLTTVADFFAQRDDGDNVYELMVDDNFVLDTSDDYDDNDNDNNNNNNDNDNDNTDIDINLTAVVKDSEKNSLSNSNNNNNKVNKNNNFYDLVEKNNNWRDAKKEKYNKNKTNNNNSNNNNNNNNNINNGPANDDADETVTVEDDDSHDNQNNDDDDATN